GLKQAWRSSGEGPTAAPAAAPAPASGADPRVLQAASKRRGSPRVDRGGMDHIRTPRPATRDTLARLRRGAPVRLLGVWAHPDDEAYLSAGLMSRVAVAGGRVTCLTATRGEQGVPADDPRDPDEVGRLRERELRAALAAAGAHDLRLLGHRDGGCDAVPHERGVAAVARAIADTRPEVIVTFGPDGITGHPDHVAVHRWTTD